MSTENNDNDPTDTTDTPVVTEPPQEPEIPTLELPEAKKKKPITKKQKPVATRLRQSITIKKKTNQPEVEDDILDAGSDNSHLIKYAAIAGTVLVGFWLLMGTFKGGKSPSNSKQNHTVPPADHGGYTPVPQPTQSGPDCSPLNVMSDDDC